LEHELNFSIDREISSSQLTNIFQSGRYTTNQKHMGFNFNWRTFGVISKSGKELGDAKNLPSKMPWHLCVDDGGYK